MINRDRQPIFLANPSDVRHIAAMQLASAYRQLSPTEKRFVDGYVERLEREAARNNDRLSNALYREIPADVVQASQGLLEKPMVNAAISERVADISAQNELTVHRVIKEYMSIAFSSIGNYMDIDEGGDVSWDFAKATPEMLAAVKSYEVDEKVGMHGGATRKTRIVLHDKLAGLKGLADFMGLNNPDNPHWRASQARDVTPALPAGVTDESAGDAYARMIGG